MGLYTLVILPAFIYHLTFIHGIKKIKKVDETDDWYRFRQINPEILKKRGYTKFRNKVIIPNEVEFIFAYN